MKIFKQVQALQKCYQLGVGDKNKIIMRFIVCSIFLVLYSCQPKIYKNSRKLPCNFSNSEINKFEIDSIIIIHPTLFLAHGRNFNFHDLLLDTQSRTVVKDSGFINKSRRIFSKDKQFSKLLNKGNIEIKLNNNEEISVSQIVIIFCKYLGSNRSVYMLCTLNYQYYGLNSKGKCEALYLEFVELFNSRIVESFK